MKKGIIFIVIYIIFSLFFILYINQKKYIILNNDYMFEVKKNSLKSIKKYPSYLNNSKIYYYNNFIKYDGYINIKTNKLKTDQENGNNIDTYTKDYKKIIGNNFVVTSNIKKFNIVDIFDIKTNKLNSEEKELIQDKLNINFESIKKIDAYKLDLNNDNIKDSIYILNSIDLDKNDYQDEVPKFIQYGLVKINENIDVLFSNNSTTELYTLKNIFDLNNDNIYEINFLVEDVEDIYYSCQSIFMNNKEYKNCNMNRGDN